MKIENPTVESLTVGRDSLAATSVVIGDVGYAFVGGGAAGYNFSDAVDVYKVDSTGASLWRWSEGNDPSNTGTYIAPLTVARNSLIAASVVVNNAGYVFFGSGSGSGSNGVEVNVYKVDSTGASLWKSSSNGGIEPLSVGRYYLAAASVVVNGIGYVFLGGGGRTNSVDVYKVDSTGASLWKFSHTDKNNFNTDTNTKIAPLTVARD